MCSRFEEKLIYVYFLEDKGDTIAFIDGKFLVWGKESSIGHAG